MAISITINSEYWLVFVDVILYWLVGQILGARVTSARASYKARTPPHLVDAHSLQLPLAWRLVLTHSSR